MKVFRKQRERLAAENSVTKYLLFTSKSLREMEDQGGCYDASNV